MWDKTVYGAAQKYFLVDYVGLLNNRCWLSFTTNGFLEVGDKEKISIPLDKCRLLLVCDYDFGDGWYDDGDLYWPWIEHIILQRQLVSQRSS